MADVVSVHTSSILLHTGKCQLAGVVLTCSSGNATATFSDSVDGATNPVFSVSVTYLNPLVIFFGDRYAPRFATHLYLTLAANLIATVWSRQL